MTEAGPKRPYPTIRNSLSSRLLLLTVGFVMLAEVFIFVPSIARYRVSYLEQMLAEANLAALSLLAAPDAMVSEDLKKVLLDNVGVAGVVLKLDDRRMLLLVDDMPPMVDDTVDLRTRHTMNMITEALTTLAEAKPRMLRVIGDARGQPGATVEILMDETDLRDALRDYAWNIFWLSLVISAVTALMVFASLQWLMVRPMRRLVENMMAFRRDPESRDLPGLPGRERGDEIGVAAAALAEMERDLRQALVQKNHLAALGLAISKISHDLRNILATAQVVSEFLSNSDDPVVKRMAPRLLGALDRGLDLCERSLRFGRADEREPWPTEFDLAELVDECGGVVGLSPDLRAVWQNDVAPGFRIHADREQVYRVLMNLGRNAVQAAGPEGTVRVSAENGNGKVVIRVLDTGPGLPAKARENLFKPFVGSGRSDGTGLGLAIARDLVIANGGAIALERTGSDGTVFRITLPANRP
ncbi:MAG: HAMP domain-containing sensor histidine kinase [Pseudomonadota bacterium]|nr:HAMP domain-containing sensor histidine kinase [Pseudomonadota bacterium]